MTHTDKTPPPITHDNPWTADLVHIPKGVYDIADSNEWVRLDVPFFKDT